MLRFWGKLCPKEMPLGYNEGDRTFYDAISLENYNYAEHINVKGNEVVE